MHQTSSNLPLPRLPARILRALLLAGVALWSGDGMLSASEPAGGTLVVSSEPGWPQWRGQRRDGVSTETGLLQSWPEDGPPRLRTFQGIGRGYSSPIITGDTLYITGDVGSDLRVFAFALDGTPKWQATNGGGWKKSWPGCRASCVYDNGRIFVMNALGRVACMDAATGTEIWSANIAERFAAKCGAWGFAECLVVDGQRVIVTPVGARALMAALDRDTGETAWVTPAIAGDNHAYTSPILFELAGRRQLVSYSDRHQFGVDAETGNLLWKLPWGTDRQMIGPMPVLDGNAVLTSSSGIKGGHTARIQLDVDADGVKANMLWTAPVDDLHGTSVLYNGDLFVSGHRTHKGWACLDPQTGKMRYAADDIAKGSVIYADGRLYCLSQDGVMSLLEPGGTGFQVRGRFRLAEPRKPDVWAVPVICDGRLYLRYHDALHCYDVRR